MTKQFLIAILFFLTLLFSFAECSCDEQIINRWSKEKMVVKKNHQVEIDGGVVSLYNNDSLLVEEFGNEGSYDNDMNYRVFYEYNEDQRLKNKKFYRLEDDNYDCIIIDSLNYGETVYFYDSLGLKETHYYNPKYLDFDEDTGMGKIIGRELSIITNVRAGKSKFFNMEENDTSKNK